MGKIESELLDEKELKRLESRVNSLVQAYEALKKENSLLKVQQDTYTAERANLIDKNEQARKRVEAMITRLKSMEVSL